MPEAQEKNTKDLDLDQRYLIERGEVYFFIGYCKATAGLLPKGRDKLFNEEIEKLENFLDRSGKEKLEQEK